MLLSTKEWIDAPDVGAFFDIITYTFTDTGHRVTEKKYQVDKDRQYTLKSIETILVSVLNCATNKAYHTGATSMGATGFGTLTALQIILRMQWNYGKPYIMEVKNVLLWLNEPMDCNMPIEVMLRGLEEVQMFLLTSPEENRELTEVKLIDHDLIKI